ncbi:Uncharacterised protein [Lysinibacillus capsici]|uniref:Uncharacterized protein n=1 Tax=Lysinibacillus capsici TaxID=2115968 RepID=A0A2X0Z216_9BACI|nr:hypothetical protein [Lysinibacillus capsici]SPT96481.1 Uncharacterised protein [Lysinibacillus capsici]
MTIAHTQILLKFFNENGLDENTLESLLNEEKFEGLSYKYQVHTEDIFTLTVYSEDLHTFEKKRDHLIKYLKNITEYLSITHDSKTKSYIEEIGKTIYDLERSFRTLIEFVFLNKFKSKWKEEFPSLGHDRKSKRGAPIIYLDNPLDDWDFIHLNRFIKEQISFIDQDVQTKLRSIGESILSINTTSDLEKIKEGVLLKIDDLIKLPRNNKIKDITYTQLYTHLTPSLASDWEKLYNLRNFWAHNVAILTRTEFESYKNLYKGVLNNIQTEITILSLFSEENQQSYLTLGQDAFKITIFKSKYEGRDTVQLKGKFINEDNNIVSFKKNNVTYYHILNLFKEVLTCANDTEKLLEINACFEYNPFLKLDFIELGEYISEKFESCDNVKSVFQSHLSNEGYDIFTKNNEVIMSEDVDEYLSLIFKNE